MDTFFEQIVVRRKSSAEKTLKIMMIVFGVLAVLVMLYIAFFRIFGMFSFLFVPLAFGTAILLFFWIKNMYIEYEYCLTNGTLDIDRIKGKRKRERLITVECADFEEFGEYDSSAETRLKNRTFAGTAFAANHDSKRLFYAVSKHRAGVVLIIIEPDDRVCSGLKKFIPRSVQKDTLAFAEKMNDFE